MKSIFNIFSLFGSALSLIYLGILCAVGVFGLYMMNTSPMALMAAQVDSGVTGSAMMGFGAQALLAGAGFLFVMYRLVRCMMR